MKNDISKKMREFMWLIATKVLCAYCLVKMYVLVGLYEIGLLSKDAAMNQWKLVRGTLIGFGALYLIR